MSNFDPEFDKLPDQPVTIVGGGKSAAAWHPNSGTDMPRVDRISDQAMAVNQMRETARFIDVHGKAPDDLAEFLRHWTVVVSDALVSVMAERNALAHVLEQVRVQFVPGGISTGPVEDATFYELRDVTRRSIKRSRKVRELLGVAPAVSLALHDAEVKAQALEEAADAIDGHWAPDTAEGQEIAEGSASLVRDRAAAIRAEAK